MEPEQTRDYLPEVAGANLRFWQNPKCTVIAGVLQQGWIAEVKMWNLDSRARFAPLE